MDDLQTPLIINTGLSEQSSRQTDEIRSLERKQEQVKKQLDELTHTDSESSVVKQVQIHALESQLQQIENRISQKQIIKSNQQKANAEIDGVSSLSLGKSIDLDI